MKTITLRMKGLCLGQPLKIRCFMRESVGQTKMPCDVLFWGDSSTPIDYQKMTVRQSNALPRAWTTTTKASNWEAFGAIVSLDGRTDSWYNQITLLSWSLTRDNHRKA